MDMDDILVNVMDVERNDENNSSDNGSSFKNSDDDSWLS